MGHGRREGADIRPNTTLAGTSAAGIPTYTWRYVAGTEYSPAQTFFGAMAQDLLSLGRADAVSMGRPVLLFFFVLGLPHVTLIELRLDLIPYHDYHICCSLSQRRLLHGRLRKP